MARITGKALYGLLENCMLLMQAYTRRTVISCYTRKYGYGVSVFNSFTIKMSQYCASRLCGG